MPANSAPSVGSTKRRYISSALRPLKNTRRIAGERGRILAKSFACAEACTIELSRLPGRSAAARTSHNAIRFFVRTCTPACVGQRPRLRRWRRPASRMRSADARSTAAPRANGGPGSEPRISVCDILAGNGCEASIVPRLHANRLLKVAPERSAAGMQRSRTVGPTSHLAQCCALNTETAGFPRGRALRRCSACSHRLRGRRFSEPPLDLGHYRGQVVVVDFWASWCKPCRQSIPWLNDLRTRYASQGLVIVGVNVDLTGRCRTFPADVPIGFDVMYDPRGKMAEQFRCRACQAPSCSIATENWSRTLLGYRKPPRRTTKRKSRTC